MTSAPTPPPHVVRAAQALASANIVARAVGRTVVRLAVLGGCTHLVFWRGESGWLYLAAIALLVALRLR